jgi:hypothetical protein
MTNRRVVLWLAVAFMAAMYSLAVVLTLRALF